MNRALRSALAVAALLGGFVPAARADISAFNDFGADYSFDTGHAWGVTGSSSPIGQTASPACSFISDASGKITSLDIALGYADWQATKSATVNVFADDGTGEAPGTLLESFNLANIPPTESAPIHLTANHSVALSAGKRYWVQAVSDAGGWDNWMLNNQALATNFVSEPYYPPGSVQTAGAFDVNVAPVPESSTFAAFALVLGLGGVFLIRLRSAKSAQ